MVTEFSGLNKAAFARDSRWFGVESFTDYQDLLSEYLIKRHLPHAGCGYESRI